MIKKRLPFAEVFITSRTAPVFLSEEKGWTDEIFAVSGEEIFSGSKINESVALQKELREIKCIDPIAAIESYSKAKEKYSRWD